MKYHIFHILLRSRGGIMIQRNKKNNFGMHQHTCCGTTQIGERGQVVIPADVRKTMNLKSGDKLITFVKSDKALVMIKAENVEKIVAGMTEKMNNLKKILGK